MKAELLYDTKVELGEGPVWDARTGTLFWIDILGKRMYAGAEVIAELEETVGCFALRKSGGFIFTGQHSFRSLETATGETSVLLTLREESAHNRFNDGKCDPCGRFLAGTMDLGESKNTGSLYSFDGKVATKLLGGVTISNGLAWSPDYRTFYFIDTPTRTVRAFDYDLETGAIANGRVVLQVEGRLGWPDGMTSDMQGNLWIAMWAGEKITKWNPYTGDLLAEIPVPAKNVSSCVFGGKHMNELFVTSARKGLDRETLEKYPLTGGMFRIETDVEGMPSFEFGD